MDLDGCGACWKAIRDGESKPRAVENAGALALLARDPQRQPVRLPGRRAARRAPRARRADARRTLREDYRRRRRRAGPGAIARVSPPKPGPRCATPRKSTRRCAASRCCRVPNQRSGRVPAEDWLMDLARACRHFAHGWPRHSGWRRRAARSGCARSIPHATMHPPIAAASPACAPFRRAAKPAPRKFCAAGSNVPDRARIRTGTRPGHAADIVDQALAQLEAEGQILRGPLHRQVRAMRWNGATAACWRASTA
jgi:hypothetical protein